MSDNANLSIPPDSKIRDVSTDVLYDVIILGAGPAGLTAAVYVMRKGMNAALLTKNIGGQVLETASVENYMGYRYIEGTDLIRKFFEQIKQFPISFREGVDIVKVWKDGGTFSVLSGDGSIYRAKSLIISTGKSPRRLNVPGEREFAGRGVAYCAICDAPLYAGLKVAVVGGGNSALESAIDLCRIASEVHIIQFMPELTADKVLINKINEFNNLKVYYNCRATKIRGDKMVNGIDVVRNDSGEAFSLDVDGVFITIGLIPNTSFIGEFLMMNAQKEIIVNCDSKTSVEGVFAAGDVTSVSVKQIIVAAGEGAKASIAAYQYLIGVLPNPI